MTKHKAALYFVIYENKKKPKKHTNTFLLPYIILSFFFLIKNMVLFPPPSLRTKKLQIPSITEGSTGSQGAADADVAVSEPKK